MARRVSAADVDLRASVPATDRGIDVVAESCRPGPVVLIVCGEVVGIDRMIGRVARLRSGSARRADGDAGRGPQRVATSASSGRRVGRRSGDLGDQEERAVEAGAEALGDAGRRPGGWCRWSAGCRASAKPSRSDEHRDGEHEQDHEAAATSAGHGRRWMTRLHRYQTDSAARRLRPAAVGQAEAVDVAADEAEERGQQRDRREHRDERRAIEVPTAMPRMKSTPMRSRPSSEMTTVLPANSTARPAVSIARDDGVPRGRARREALAVAGDDEQRVVDADADADHRRQLRGEARHRDDVGAAARRGRRRCRCRTAR